MLRAEHPVFGEAERDPALHRALKARFDPHGILNPGRLAGRT